MGMDKYKLFKTECEKEIENTGQDKELLNLTHTWFDQANRHKYSYHFEWLGRPIIQYPQDIVAMQELIWLTRPDLIIETGIAHGGSLIFSASMLAMLDVCDAFYSGRGFDQQRVSRRVLGIDIDIREHNFQAIEAHPLAPYIEMIQGSSTDPEVISMVKDTAAKHSSILVCLDSNHTHEHVLAELNAYAPLVTKGSYCVVFDTIIEDLPESMFPDRPWGPGNNPKTAVWEYLKTNKDFEIDRSIQHKLLITVAPDGFLKRIAG